ncbi:MAG: hypothetical protein AB4911_12975 [Oscillochloridaceae bacterium umkhey_bin13]
MTNTDADETSASQVTEPDPSEAVARYGFAPSPITDGSQVLRHDGYDVQEYQEALATYSSLDTLAQEARQRLITAPALLADLFWSFIKRAPTLAPVVPLSPAYHVNALILTQMMGTIEWAQVRQAGTVGDMLTSAMATRGVAATLLQSLDQATLDRVNQLHALETGTTELFARAEALDELAAQAQGDRAALLFAEAHAARQRAEAQAHAATQLQHELVAATEQIEEASRRVSRTALVAAEAAIDEAQAAIATFGGGYGPGMGGSNQLTTREKIALAQQVGQSQRLQQIAAVCGRFTRIALQVQTSKVQHPPDEITSITSGRDLGRILPSELALLADRDLEARFFLQYAEGRLMQYDLIGNERQGQGPIIVALDSSGSMTAGTGFGGMTKEVWSKAVMLALLAIARLQRRDMAVIHFSGPGQLATYHFPKGTAPHADVIACTDHFVGGGTVFEPWMEQALTLVDQAVYDRADVICISDGLTQIQAQAQAAWQRRRDARGMRAYSVLIGTNEGAHVLAQISDALLTLATLTDDMPILETIFAV